MSYQFKVIIMAMIYIFGAITLNKIVPFPMGGNVTSMPEAFGAFFLQVVWFMPWAMFACLTVEDEASK